MGSGFALFEGRDSVLGTMKSQFMPQPNLLPDLSN